MKVVVVFILIAIGVFLFRRAQRLAKEEQEAMMAKKSTEKTRDTSASPDEAEPTPDLAPSATNESEAAAAKAPEVELMPRDVEPASRVELSEDIIDVEIPAATHDENVIILADTHSADADKDSAIPENDTLTTKASETKEESEAVDVPVKAKESAESSPEVASTPLAKDESLAALGSWANVTLARAAEEYQSAETALARYNALQNVIAECYKQRKSTEYLAYGAALHGLYLALFHSANAEKPKELELKTPGFMQLATLLNDTQDFDKAIALCQEALKLGLTDGTVTGFEGRISRIEKAQAKATTA
ncbi:hypothetical protein N7V09_04035 [Shewanella seohaensis]|uniref:hypothetical protein n=1 Tax=Shewanella seohaensis TaxID=755175 RepID=UPI00200C4DEC|nr:hypothetical protein [Shewanella seohaensis]MCL1122128.1 hypothetical protein [Shewanella seohaensis]UXM82773.1 hypothetical protein N7V09_04035 [Shewanella seohaensis]